MHDTDYRRRKEVWLELFELDPATRSRRLDMLAGEDAELAASLRAQFAATDQASPLLDRVGRGAQPPELPQYELIRELGRGGMGRVWLAERRLGDAVQSVALKQIVHAGWDAEDRRRFERERRILATLSHPNIAALVDGGSDVHGAPFLATTFVDGERIDRHVAAHALPVAARVRLIARIAEAVAYAHRRLVVHRDLKPANILVGADGEPMLLDFGVARLLGEEAITSTGPSQMTLRYAAPEQVRGDSDHAGVGNDIYALGVLLYELLTGASPYGEVRDQAALVAAILHGEPSPPSKRLRGLGADLDAIVLKALRKRPEDRYAGAGELAEDLGRWLAHQPVEARRGERGYRARKWLRRRWPWLAAASLAAAFLGYHVITLDRQLDRVARERDRAQALARYFGELFKGARPADTERGDISARELLERSVQALRDDTATPAATRATMLLAAGDALVHLGREAPAREVHELSLALLRSAPGVDAELLVRVLDKVATRRTRAGDAAGALAANQEALGLIEAGRVRDPQLSVTVRHHAAALAEHAGDVEAERAGYEGVIALARPLLGTREGIESFVSAHTNLALLDMRHNDGLPAAEARLREALDAARRHALTEPDILLPVRTYLLRTLCDQRRLAEARDVFEPLLREARDYYGSNDLWLAVVLSQGGALAMLEGRVEDAVALYDEVLAIESIGQGESVYRRQVEALRATVALAAGEWNDAVARLQPVLEWRQRSGRSADADAGFERAALAYAQCRLQPSAQSRAALQAALVDAADFRGWKSWLAGEWRDDC